MATAEWTLGKSAEHTGETRIAESDGQVERVIKEQSKPVGKLGIVAERADLGSLDNLREPPPAPKRTRECQRLDARELLTLRNGRLSEISQIHWRPWTFTTCCWGCH